MIPNSAMVTVGESAKTLAAIDAGTSPRGEFSVLKNHLGTVKAMVDTSYDPASMADGARFAWSAYRATRDAEAVYLSEEFPGLQYLAVHAAHTPVRLARRSQKRITMLIHNVASPKRRLPLGTLRGSHLLNHVLCLSTQSKSELTSSYGISSRKVTVIGSRVDTEFFTPEPAAAIKTQVCAAGAVNRDYQTLVEAMRPLGVDTKIAADTQWAYTAGIKALDNLPAHVDMRSWGNYVNLRSLYAESAVVVVPLQAPILSGVTVALEAMAMGRPVILTDNAYVRDFLVDEETGYFVPAGDVDALRAKVKYVLDQPEQAAEVGRRAREWVLQNFTLQQYVDKILSTLS
jgi:glycosyltransferase involved in cell wall biosynthesis